MKLIEKHPAEISLNLGDANAISGGLNLHDSHNVSTVSNVTNNITTISPLKSDTDSLQEKKNIFLVECKRAYEDGVLDSGEKAALEEIRIKLGIDQTTAKEILETVRLLAARNTCKTSLNPVAKTKLKILSENLLSNNVPALRAQLGNMAAIVNKYEHDDLSRKFFLALAVLTPRKCIEMMEESTTDSYWKSYWCYLAYIREKETDKAEVLLAGLDRFADYPEDNLTILAAAGALMGGNMDEAREYLEAVTGDYTPDLQRFVDSVYLLLDPDVAREMGADAFACAFYLVNMFGQKDPKVAAAEEAERRAREETERKAREEAERKVRKEAERKAREEAERKARDEVKRKAAKEAANKAKEGTERKADRAPAVKAVRDKGKASEVRRNEKKENSINTSREPQSVILTDLTRQLITHEKYAEALKKLRPLAKDGDTIAQYQLGLCYYNGWGVKQNQETASSWFKKSAVGGHVPAMFAMGFVYEEGKGVVVNSEEAVKWYRMAAAKGHADSLFHLGMMFDEGRGVNQSTKKALELLEKASQNGSEEAKKYLEQLQTCPSVSITKIRFEKEYLCMGKPSLCIHVDFDALNLKGKVLNCSVYILHDVYPPVPVRMDKGDPEAFSFNGELGTGATTDALNSRDVSFTDVCFAIPYFYLCRHDTKGTFNLIARIVIYDVSKKKPQRLMERDKKFSITCQKKLLSGTVYDVTW